MSQLTPQLDANLRGPAPLVFGAISIDLPGASVNLLDGAGVLAFGGRTFVGKDDTYGAISDVENLTDGTGDSAPAFSMTLIPSGDAAAAALSGPEMQGAPVYVWMGAVDKVTGIPIPDPHLVFIGELDVPILKSDEQGRLLDYEVVSVFERLFEDDESARLSDGFHQSIFPGELGYMFVTGVAQTIYWGVAGTNSTVTSYGSGSSYSLPLKAQKISA
jgi:hypothetical protein